jgi:hypothetical protein
MGHSHILFVRRFSLNIAIALAIVATQPSIGFAHQRNTLLGTWRFLPEKSTFVPGPVPYRSMTMNFTAMESGLKNEAKGVGTDGKPIHATFMIVTDGKFYPVTGLSAFDSSSYIPVSDRTTVYVRRKHGTSVIAGSRMVSSDGETLFFREKEVNSLGRETGRAVLVFDKQ